MPPEQLQQQRQQQQEEPDYLALPAAPDSAGPAAAAAAADAIELGRSRSVAAARVESLRLQHEIVGLWAALKLCDEEAKTLQLLEDKKYALDD
ncbi:unnamed protein product [Polarella glacialis]|uniref:Uncharacterized protein n=1 Tax=Polarella glacialis TaxID=89957 RepID=A0A813FFF1_POLGL|nr:unnamed protein product [Polarella glacialis]